MTLIHEKGSELHWKDVRELVVGERTIRTFLAPGVSIKRVSKPVFVAASAVIVPKSSVSYPEGFCFYY